MADGGLLMADEGLMLPRGTGEKRGVVFRGRFIGWNQQFAIRNQQSLGVFDKLGFGCTYEGANSHASYVLGIDAPPGADLDAIAARYQPQADAFANELDAFITSQIPVMPPEAQAQMAQMGPVLRARITGSPATIKAGLIQQAAAAAPASQ
jgi:hypothetical protein